MKMRYRYKHAFKGDMWSRNRPVTFRKENGSGWKLIKKVTESEFRKR